VPKASSLKADAFGEPGQNALLPQVLRQEHEFAPPRRRTGQRVSGRLDNHRSVGDTVHMLLLDGKTLILPHQGDIFFSWMVTCQLVALLVGTLSETLIEPDANDGDATVLELDELWSFVLKKTNQAWIWIALCRKTRQVVAYAVGDRSEKTCRCLWEAIPLAYRVGHCFTDFWIAYQAVIPENQHTAAGKETGETAHVERWNNTLRQRLARFVRKTLSFSKSLVMHEACLKLFLHRYNRERAAILI
jgi:insertion element IS1 protein InsB